MTVSFDSSSGISYKGSTETSIHNLVNTTSCTLYAPSASSLTLSKGTGNPTWSRATTAWGFNELGFLRDVPSGCAMFGGVRLVLNMRATASEDITGFIKVGSVTTPSANLLVCANATSAQYIVGGAVAGGVTINHRYCHVIRARRVAGGVDYIQSIVPSTGFGVGQYANFSLIDGSVNSVGLSAKSVYLGNNTYDFIMYPVATATDASNSIHIVLANSLSDGRLASFSGDGVKSVEILTTAIYDVTGYDTSYVPEYVSVGVVSTPFFGAGIDGARYFETDWKGAPIPAANKKKIRLEGAATNNLLYSRDLSNAAWSTKTNITAAKTATGLDGIANTATTLTATAADATILQPITLTSADRCASAYVKRMTGTATISFTQDGGSTWTDITSLINSSTWARVGITSTLANPSVGFKISTSGDAIAVDCVQNEVGTVATSPIVTTTATVTRNADSLTYQTASNWSDTAGTAVIEVQPYVWSVGGLVGSATNGLLESGSNSGATSYDGTNAANGPTGTPSERKKLAMSWGNSKMTVASDGIVGTPGTYDGAMGLSSIGIGVGSVGYFGPITIYDFAMNAAELKVITA